MGVPGHGLLGVLAAYMVSCRERCLDRRVLVHMLEHQGLADRRLVVDALAAVTVAACPHLKEEGTINLVHLRPVDPGQPISH